MVRRTVEVRSPIGAVALLLGLGLPCAGWAQGRDPNTFEVTGVLDSRLAETSGVAVSRRLPGILWTHNDSGDGPIIYAITVRGELRGASRVPGVSAAIDWEDIALGPCPDGPERSCLFIADSGNNLGRREGATVYIFPEPDSAGASDQSPPARAVHVRYPDGAPDVEALAVAPNGEMLLISKGSSGPAILYRISPADVRRDSLSLSAGDTLAAADGPLRNVTGAAISPDGTELVVRTYVALHFFTWGDGPLRERTPSCQLGFRQLQGESVDYLDGSMLVLTSEAALGRPASVAVVGCGRR